MEREKFCALLDEVFELPAGTLKGAERLEDLGWTSLTMMSVIALIDENFQVTLSPRQLVKCNSVDDILGLACAAA